MFSRHKVKQNHFVNPSEGLLDFSEVPEISLNFVFLFEPLLNCSSRDNGHISIF